MQKPLQEGMFTCDPSRHVQESPGPPGPKSLKRLQKPFWWGPAKKSPKKNPRSPKMPQKVQFSAFLGHILGYFRGLFCRPPPKRLLRHFSASGPGGPGDSCTWRLGSPMFTTNNNEQNLHNNSELVCKLCNCWETDFLPLLVLTRRGAAPAKTSTGNNFPRKYQRIPRNYYRYWC